MKSRRGKSNATPNRPPLTGGFQSRMYAKNSKGFIHHFHRDEVLGGQRSVSKSTRPY